MLAAFTNTPHAVMMLCTPEALDGNQPSAIKENLFAEGFREPRVIPAVSFVTKSRRVS